MTRLNVDKPLTVRSVNGPQLTVINGGGSNDCVYFSDGANVSGFTLTNALVFLAPPRPLWRRWCALPRGS